ncbi:MAG TPA: alanine--tRNA ligase, partial [Bacteroidales bacterium]|nr:alanine--tRNA ligase [Bacteroidales bacterium]
FSRKQHHIVQSAPIVVKNDPTLMFTNAGMNQFKEIFLGNTKATQARVADTQKCLRVSGKHNDLEEVGLDTYHHTMFEMLGNWSFGDYFKKEAIEWAWELLTEEYGISKSDIYVTVFGGDDADGLQWDAEAFHFWETLIPESRILRGSKKDNFWEMGNTGPCGPCSEIHVDIRSESEKIETPGYQLVNQGHPHVIEIWNLVFIQFNRQADGKLVQLPDKHIDTGMGFERLCMILQKVKSNYDTDIFQPLISEIENITGITYGAEFKSDVAMRVIADHVRAVAFAIADGQLPSNNKAGYVIRRILRRAVRYYFSSLNRKEPLIFLLVPVLIKQMGEMFPELVREQQLLEKVIREEELSFLRTLAIGIQRFQNHCKELGQRKIIEGAFAFELYDTYGFPVDLTQLMAREAGLEIDIEAFEAELEKQKSRSRQDAAFDADDWNILNPGVATQFVGWETTSTTAQLLRFRRVIVKGKDLFHVVLDQTPFYPESGGQVGDCGYLSLNGSNYQVTDTRKENNLIIHILSEFPQNPPPNVLAVVDNYQRRLTANNHTATHLLHDALRTILGSHIEQKGSFVGPEYLRFDFSHFQRLSHEELEQVEKRVNFLIRENIQRIEYRDISIEEAQQMGAIMFFNEKYGERVRAIRFGNSIELCGGTHSQDTATIGLFKIVSESAIAAGIRRIEAVTSEFAFTYIEKKLALLDQLLFLLKHPGDPIKTLGNLLDQSSRLQKQISEMHGKLAVVEIEKLLSNARTTGSIRIVTARTGLDNDTIKDMAFNLRQTEKGLIMLLGAVIGGKPFLHLFVSTDLVTSGTADACVLIRELAKEIQGGGGGQPFYATAGGKNLDGLNNALSKLNSLYP